MALRIVVSLEIGNFAVHIFDLHSGRLIQIPLELLPLDQRPISVHNVEIFVWVLVDQHTQLPFTDVIVASGLLDGQRVSAPHRNVKIVLLVTPSMVTRLTPFPSALMMRIPLLM